MCSPDCNSVCLGGIGSEIKSPPGLFLHTSYIFQLPGTASSTAGPTSAPFTQVLCAVLVTHRGPPGLELSLQDNPAPRRPVTYLVRLGVPCAPGTRPSQSFSCTTGLYMWAPQPSPCGCRQSLHWDVPFSCLKYTYLELHWGVQDSHVDLANVTHCGKLSSGAADGGQQGTHDHVSQHQMPVFRQPNHPLLHSQPPVFLVQFHLL